MKFKRVYVEICNTCNLSCAFCTSKSVHPQVMSKERFQAVIEQVRPFTSYLYLHVLGEPLMHPQLADILHCCRQAGMQVQMTSNGTLLAKRLALLQAYPPRQINISVHSYWEQPAAMAKDYLHQVLSCGDVLAADSYISYRLWQSKGEGDVRTQLLLEALCEHYGVTLSAPVGSVALASNRFLSFASPFAWPSLQDPFLGDRGRCRGLLDMIAILCNGDVVPCCLDAHGGEVLGNVFAEPLAEILAKAHTQKLREGMRQGVLYSPLCQRCTYRLRFDRKRRQEGEDAHRG